MQLLHPVRMAVHRLANGGVGVRCLHLAGLAIIAWLRGRGEPDSQARELMLQHSNGCFVQVAADQGQVQIPTLRPPVSSLDPGRDDARIARRDDSLGREPVQAEVRTVRSDSPV